MKIAISSKGKTLDSEIDERFGRCAQFLIVETSAGQAELVEAMPNEAASRAGGAGPFAAKQLAEKKVDCVITGEVGPHAQEVLDQFGIRIYKGAGKASEALEAFIKENEGDSKEEDR
ncbi:NifB/NifX family molybdenum-iron cluster-binding protein [Candidatus Woesearchaeota archaeon]|nr:NifB/NifX family molybdenum-iron cluster-binding protein [Candidatus Woesearchaeota archaeon]